MEEFVRKELQNYLQEHLTDNVINCIDDIILSYIVTVLSQLPQDNDSPNSNNSNAIEDSNNIEELIELLVAYIPEISVIDRSSLSEWLFDLPKKFQSFSIEKERSSKPVNREGNKKKSNVTGVTSVKKDDSIKDATLKLCNEAGIDGDTRLKEFVVNRFALTEDTEGKEHHPVLVQREKKKMLRYRDNVVVSTKGERYTTESNKDSEEMKKTYINLKPLRKYRFHK